MVSTISPANVNTLLGRRKVVISEIIDVLEFLMNKSVKARSTALTRIQEVKTLAQKSAQDIAFERSEDKQLEKAYSDIKRLRNTRNMAAHAAQIQEAIHEEQEASKLLSQMRNEESQEMRVLKDETANFAKEITAIEALLAFIRQHKNRVLSQQEAQKVEEEWGKLESAILKNISDLKLEQAIEAAEIRLSSQISRFSGHVRQLVRAING